MEAGWIAAGITLVLALVAGSVTMGRLFEKVKGNRSDINENRDEQRQEREQDRKENREEHNSMSIKLDAVLKTPR
ncbi:hypothetical protein LCGC14_1138940 [marine sediment metagenome]|uniref:Uncharacterized protein n=1 Tax=marine sediment metagenome TaxID=412755 RepID=A0A0F9PH26_9ZZZZ